MTPTGALTRNSRHALDSTGRAVAAARFQFRDAQVKAAAAIGDLAHSQYLLAYKTRDMTEHYVKRVGERVRALR
jgi:hypothetical protein